ncbi:MAG: DUF3105 domain-containing protein [Solirubrobacterales bacterium]
MASKKEEREQRRQERLDAEEKDRATARRRRLGGFALAGVLGGFAIAGIVVVILGSSGDDGGGGGGDSAQAFVRPDTGAVDDLKFDEREGTDPPAPKETDLKAAAKAANCELEMTKSRGNKHEREGTDLEYKDTPPTSGDHWEVPAADGAFREQIRTERAVHSLEHGRIQIQYQPDLPEAEQLQLKGLLAEDSLKVMLFPNPDLEAPVVVAAWENSLTCEKFSPEIFDAIRTFREEFRDQGPEFVP